MNTHMTHVQYKLETRDTVMNCIYVPFANEMGCLLGEETGVREAGGLNHVFYQPTFNAKIIGQRDTLNEMKQHQCKIIHHNKLLVTYYQNIR